MKEAQVALTEGKGKKRRFNGKLATVLPLTKRRGGWTDIQIPKTTQVLSWRSNAWRKPQKGDLAALPDVVMSRVLSFLVTPYLAEWDHIKTSIFTLATLLTVNRDMNQRLKRTIISVIFNGKDQASVNILHLDGDQTFRTLMGLLALKIPIRGLHVCAQFADLDLLSTFLHEHQSLSTLESFTIKSSAGPWETGYRTITGRWIVPRVTEPDNCIDLTRYSVSPIRVVWERTIHPNYLPFTTLPKLYSQFMPRFSSLTELRLGIEIDNNPPWDAANDCIFEIPTLKQFDLLLMQKSRGLVPRDPSVAFQLLSKKISEMKQLSEFTLRINVTAQDNITAFMNHFTLCSDSLRIARLRNLPKQYIMLRCVCPKLELLECTGGHFGGGVRPNDPRVWINTGYPANFEGTRASATLAECPMYGMTAPETCVVTFH